MLTFFLHHAEKSVPVKAVQQMFAKEVIIAMSQLAAAEEKPKYENDVYWVRRFVSNSCAALNFVSYGHKMQKLINEFCDRLDIAIDVSEVRIDHSFHGRVLLIFQSFIMKSMNIVRSVKN